MTQKAVLPALDLQALLSNASQWLPLTALPSIESRLPQCCSRECATPAGVAAGVSSNCCQHTSNCAVTRTDLSCIGTALCSMQVVALLNERYKVGDELKRSIRDDILRLIEAKTYRCGTLWHWRSAVWHSTAQSDIMIT
jgi:hypothetical protein